MTYTYDQMFTCRLLPGMLLCTAAFARSPEAEYSKRIWRTEDGLPQNKIQALTQTGDGYLWIGTSGGLVRFDGVRFVVFDRSNTPALGDDSILSLCPARDGSLWIGTEGGGLVRMKAGAVRTFGPAEGLTNPFVRALAEDRSGLLWVGTDRGFFRLDGAKLHRLDGRGKGPVISSSAIFQDKTGVIWTGSNAGLYRVQGDDIVPGFSGRQELGRVTSILEDAKGALVVASESGLRRFEAGVPNALPVAPVNPHTLCLDHDGNIWVGTLSAGLLRVGKNTSVYRASDTLPDNSVLAVFEDNSQNLWVGTQDGLLRMTRSGVHTISSKDGLADDNVASVYEDPAGRLWMGTISGRMYRLEGERVVPFHVPVAGFNARSIYTDPAGTQWFSSTSHGFLRLQGGHTHVFSMRDGLRSNNIRQFLYDRNGTVWIATGSGLTRLEGDSLRTFYLEDGLSYGGVRVLAEDRNGDILVGTDGGLNRIHNGEFVRDPVFLKLGYEKVWAIHVDGRGSLWLGTRGNGLVRIRDGKITRYTTRDGLLSNSVYHILADAGSGDAGERFWMSSPAGVFAVDRRELDDVAEGRPGPIVVMPYGTDSGMLSSQMNGGIQSAGCRTRSGRLWFPSVKGAVRIDPAQLRAGPSPHVLIEAVVADDHALPVSGEIVIPPGRGKLEIDFTSPDLLSPDRVTFRYRLEGFDETWTPSPRNRAAYYTNLPPGKYRFHVVARDGASPGGTSEAFLPIVWRPYFYQTYWFYAALVILAALCIWSVFRFYARQTKARYALVLAERTRLAREMHDTVIQGCVGVSTLLEAARSMPASAQDRKLEIMERAATQVRLTVNEAREAVWDLRHSETAQNAPPTDVVETLKSFAAQVEAAEGIPVHAAIEGTPASLGNTSDRNLLLVAREAIRNAVSHAHAAGISVILHFEPKEVRLQVADDGMGFTPDATRDNAHYGIIGMRERVEQSGGTFHVSSTPGKGTQVTARIPVRTKHGERF